MCRVLKPIRRKFDKVMFRIFYNKRTRRCAVFIFLMVIIGYTLIWAPGGMVETQKQMDYIATRVKVKITSVNADTVDITLYNTGTRDVTYGNWRIYFTSISPLVRSGVDGGLTLERENGGLNYLRPVKGYFKGIRSQSSLTFSIRHRGVSRSDYLPNWYVASNSTMTSPKIIESTLGHDAMFVEPFTSANQWKRGSEDNYDPYTPKQRYELYSTLNPEFVENIPVGRRVIPTPALTSSSSDDVIQIDSSWILLADQKLLSVSKFLAERLGVKSVLQTSNKQIPAAGRAIVFRLDESFLSEEYLLHVKYPQNTITITAKSEVGAFFAIQTMFSLLSGSNTIPVVAIKDKPRFPYRGLMVDIARNFVTKDTMIKIIDLMAMYKLNVLHLHLTDDEGWRLEIPSIPELTSYTSRRCHNREKDKCLQPSLGSGPFATELGSGFYSASEFKEILRYAADRFVKVIPEVDVPGHSLAAIEAMRFREEDILRRSERGGYTYPSYLLADNFIPASESVQGWRGNAINPCLNSSYRFMDTIFNDLKSMYGDIQSLDVVHIGGDEVPNDVWMASTSCQALIQEQHYDERMLKKMFMVKVAEIARRYGLDIATWEDGVYAPADGPYKRDSFKNNNVYVNAWNNIWTEGRGGRAIEFANGGYKSILSMATHLYFDHPHEPDPEERGLYWATRYSDTYKIFGFMPDCIYSNIDFDNNGNPLKKENICMRHSCPSLEKPQNVVGMEACLWTETIRNHDHLFYMLLPRMIAYAERAWHNAAWESVNNKDQRNIEKFKDWEVFLNVLTRKELLKLEGKGVTFRIPPPGVKIDKPSNYIHINSLYPGFKLELSFDDSKWTHTASQIPIPNNRNKVMFRVVSPSGHTHSRPIEIRFNNDVVPNATSTSVLINQNVMHFIYLISLLNLLL